ncbi:hypothetical protein [Caldivirga maquilingensis]|uniref:5-methylcytosine restriction system component-like protein n=1 Tax=Caldivirga maquilingensis (strain ATCC 700844 / DSM 13496 / JCM 10307 / IC-167) TaxID=397948 RepID=A8MC23_CALMQ|nr:hypothetical protein [Caldivirga maquilingensis]ABW02807.1 conserved hypothetical protein [Caldivirga maquilingensis IC-167]
MSRQNTKQEERLRNLAYLVSKYYFSSYSNVKELIGLGMGVKVDKLTKAYIRLMIASLSLKMLRHSIDSALRDMLTYREFSVEQGSEVLGSLSVPHTIVTYPMSLYSYLTYLPSINAPEYMLLREISTMVIRRVKVAVRRLGEVIRSLNPNHELALRLRSDLGNLSRLLNVLRPKVSSLPKANYRIIIKEEYGRFSLSAPRWLRIAYESLILTKHLHSGVYVRHRRIRGNNALVMLSWRLYEVLVYALVSTALRGMGYVKSSNSLYINPITGDSVQLMFNKPISMGIIERVDELTEESNKEAIKHIVGKPDVYVKNRRSVVLECKFSTNPSYITAGRFKVMAYMYEHNANVGILVFPGLNKGIVFDDEDDATSRLYELLLSRRSRYVNLRLNDGKSMYLLVVDPGEFKDPESTWATALRRVSEVLSEAMGSLKTT